MTSRTLLGRIRQWANWTPSASALGTSLPMRVPPPTWRTRTSCSYGFWLKNTTKDGATTYNEVETFAGATGFPVTDATTLDDVTGTAMYEGGSVGVYVKNVLDDQANVVSATSGHFSADVDLTATFGGGNLPVYKKFTIGGNDHRLRPAIWRGRMTGQWGLDSLTSVPEPREPIPANPLPATAANSRLRSAVWL